jgi:ubiquinone/menaquinone biosynthesis C-methylase UbiE
MYSLVDRAKSILRTAVLRPKNMGIKYWEQRAKQHGIRSVVHLGHSEAEMESLLQTQQEELFPSLKSQLNGSEKIVMDFGCGPGRFTCQLADMIGGSAIGVDPIESLIKMAPRNYKTQYRLMPKDGGIPLADGSADVIWCCLVLGGIEKRYLARTVSEMRRVLTGDGLLFLVENTADGHKATTWIARSFENYRRLFSFVNLKHLNDYSDLGERISVMAGRVIDDELKPQRLPTKHW